MYKYAFLICLLTCFYHLVPAQKNIQLLSKMEYSQNLSSIWGWEDNQGNEYALVGLYTGVSIVDISSDPSSPVELFRPDFAHSIWREIKTWGHYAYATNETGGGVQVIDLSGLPSSIDTFSFRGAPGQDLRTAHTLWIDENGILYLFGANILGRGAAMYDLNTDPLNPAFLGAYSGGYVHDGFVRNDTLWAAEIYNGYFSVINVSDKSNPVVLNQVETPHRFTHNTWLSDDSKTLFTTDEVAGAFIAAYDVSDVLNITEIDRYQSSPGTGVVPHNVHVVGDHLVNAYYRDGVTIVDATYPDNLIEVGFYDTSPLLSAPGFNGVWGVYPYFSSGKIIASDIEEGLFVLQPTYTRAAYVEGIITSIHNEPVSNARIEVMTTNSFKRSALDGSYRAGAGEQGTYDIRFTHPNCVSKIVTNVFLETGEFTTLDVEMNCFPIGIDHRTDSPVMIHYWQSDRINIRYRLEKANSESQFRLFDLNGRKLAEGQLSRAEDVIEIQQLPAGIYFAVFSGINWQKSIKIPVY